MDPHAARRQRLLATLDGAAVFFSAPVALRNGDVEHEWRQDSDFHYLTGLHERQAALVLAPRHPQLRAVLFVRPRAPEIEAWEGPRAGVEGAAAQPGIDAAFPVSELPERLPELLLGHGRLHHRLGRDRAADDVVIEALRRARARGRSPRGWPLEVVDPAVSVGELRLHKDDAEVAAMRRAAAVTREGHLAAMARSAPGVHEYELEAVLRETFRRRGAERTAYQPIVASGRNANVIHYRANRRRMEEGDLVLVDAACELEHYAADVTRTFPVSGVFTAPQRALYEVVLCAQRAAVAEVRPGATLDDIHETAAAVVARGLRRLGFALGEGDAAHKRYCVHQTSHWLGVDVHDPALYYLEGRPRPLAPGMVITVEPGVYVAADDGVAPPEFRGMGVRIEDDLLVTSGGHDELTADIPREAAEIERACRG